TARRACTGARTPAAGAMGIPKAPRRTSQNDIEIAPADRSLRADARGGWRPVRGRAVHSKWLGENFPFDAAPPTFLASTTRWAGLAPEECRAHSLPQRPGGRVTDGRSAAQGAHTMNEATETMKPERDETVEPCVGQQRRVIRPGALRLGYADPPYIGQAQKHYSHDERCAEVDHAELIARLEAEFDGWALSFGVNLPALQEVVALLPEGSRVAVWVKPF